VTCFGESDFARGTSTLDRADSRTIRGIGCLSECCNTRIKHPDVLHDCGRRDGVGVSRLLNCGQSTYMVRGLLDGAREVTSSRLHCASRIASLKAHQNVGLGGQSLCRGQALTSAEQAASPDGDHRASKRVKQNDISILQCHHDLQERDDRIASYQACVLIQFRNRAGLPSLSELLVHASKHRDPACRYECSTCSPSAYARSGYLRNDCGSITSCEARRPLGRPSFV